jgi:hypothetical protein
VLHYLVRIQPKEEKAQVGIMENTCLDSFWSGRKVVHDAGLFLGFQN